MTFSNPPKVNLFNPCVSEFVEALSFPFFRFFSNDAFSVLTLNNRVDDTSVFLLICIGIGSGTSISKSVKCDKSETSDWSPALETSLVGESNISGSIN